MTRFFVVLFILDDTHVMALWNWYLHRANQTLAAVAADATASTLAAGLITVDDAMGTIAAATWT